MTEHPQALTLALLILSEMMQAPRNQMSVGPVLSTVLERYFPKWEDAKVADLYARLAERVQYNDTHGQLRSKCSVALHAHERGFIQ